MAARTERDIVLEQTNSWFRHSEWSVEKFANERLAPELERRGLIEPQEQPAGAEEYLRARKAWGQRLNRIFNGTAPFPLEWLRAWLDCLPADYAKAAQDECLALIGVPNLRLPQLTPTPCPSVPSRFGDLVQEFGQFVSSSTPAHNGRYDRGDDPAAVAAMVKEGLDVVFAMISELSAIAAGTGQPIPALHLLVAASEERPA